MMSMRSGAIVSSLCFLLDLAFDFCCESEASVDGEILSSRYVAQI